MAKKLILYKIKTQPDKADKTMCSLLYLLALIIGVDFRRLYIKYYY